MYPYFRLAKVVMKAYLAPPLELEEVSELGLRVWPGDVDFYPEMNNGRQLTMMDLGRMDLSIRNGLLKAVLANGWGLVVAGGSVRFRRKLRPFRKFTLRTQVLGRDPRWFYILHETICEKRICSSALIRAGVLSSGKVVASEEVVFSMGRQDWDPKLPRWVETWIEADDLRFRQGSEESEGA